MPAKAETSNTNSRRVVKNATKNEAKPAKASKEQKPVKELVEEAQANVAEPQVDAKASNKQTPVPKTTPAKGGRKQKEATPAVVPVAEPVVEASSDVKAVKANKAGKTAKPAKVEAKTESKEASKSESKPAKGKGGKAAAVKAEVVAKTDAKAETKVEAKGKGGKAAKAVAPKAASGKAGSKASKDSSKEAPKETAAKGKATPKAKSVKGAKKQQTEDEAIETVEKDQSSEAESDSEDGKDKSKFDKLVEQLAETRKSITDLQKTEKLLIKKMSNAHKTEVKRAGNRKRKPNPDPTGFVVQKEIGGKLADWLQVARGTMMSGPEISKAFWKRIAEEGLQYEDDKRIFRTNKEVSKIFGVSEKVNKSVDPSDKEGFNMRTYQTHITHALTHHNA